MIEHMTWTRYALAGAMLCSSCAGSQETTEQPQPASVAVVVPANHDVDKDAGAAKTPAESAGVPGLLMPAGDFTGLVGDADAASVLGSLKGDHIGEAYGVGGLGLTGIGRGAGETSEGTGIGIGTFGQRGSSGDGSGYGMGWMGSGRGYGRTRVDSAAPTVTGALDKEIIRRIVRSHYSRMKYCYEQGLTRAPDLAGKVTVRFSIGPNGNVTAARDTGSNMTDKAVVACVERAFRSMVFPKPRGGGVVTVVYPLVFTSATSPDAGAPVEAGADAASDR